ncbi:MAG: DUF47 domain-containing protein [Acidimicrobiia bacterium]
MRFRIVPSNREFFDDFRSMAANLATSVDHLIAQLDNPGQASDWYAKVKACERAGDELTRSIQNRLDTSFVTPFDREDIHLLSESIDDILDSIYHVSELIVLMRITEIIPEVREQAIVLQQMSASVTVLFDRLEDMKDLRETIDNIARLESEGDGIYRRTLARLFSGEFETLDVIRWKDITESMEAALDHVEDVAYAVNSILVKHA